MATRTTKKTGTGTKATEKKKRAKATDRPASGATAAPAVDPFATAPASSKKSAAVPAGDNINKAPTDDPELGNVAADIAAFAAAKAEWKTAEAKWKSVSGTVLAYSKRVLLGLMVKAGSKAPSQKLVGDQDAIVTTFYQDRTVTMDGKNVERYEALCEMFGKEIVDEQIVEFTQWTIPDEKMENEKLVAKMRAALQKALTPEELKGLFVAQHKSRKGVVDNAASLCGNDTVKMDQLLQLTVPTPTLKG